MASAELLKVTHSVDGKVDDIHGDVQDVGSKVQNVDGRVQNVQHDVQDVGNKVQDVDNKVQDIGSDVKDVSSEVREVNRSLSLLCLVVSRAQRATQGISLETTFYDGFRRQIHPSIITLHARFITRVQLDGFFKGVYSMNGKPPVLSCGYMGNVCYP